MKLINKNDEPKELKIFNANRGKKNIPWNDNRVPPIVYADIKNSLFDEQNGYCAYCLRKIDNKCRVEHFAPRSKYPNLIWDYKNMLGVDNEDASKYNGLCESGKGSKEIRISPLSKSQMEGIYYLSNGYLKHDEYQHDIDKVLNLNHQVFVSARSAMFKEINLYIQEMQNCSNHDIYDELIEIYSLSDYNYAPAAISYIENLHKKGII